MAWTNPLTWVSQNVTAALLNAELRDNLNETAPGIATTAGRFFVSDGANSIVERRPQQAVVATSETTTSTTYTNLATVGPAIAVSTGAAALVIVSATISNNTAGSTVLMGHAVTGASTHSAQDSIALIYESSGASDLVGASFAFLRTDLTTGSNTFTAVYRVTANTGTFKDRYITVIPF